MGNVPVIDEIGRSVHSIDDVFKGKDASRNWRNYGKDSALGSLGATVGNGVAGAACSITKNHDAASKCFTRAGEHAGIRR